MKSFVGGKKIYAVNLTAAGGIASEVLVINTTLQPVPVQVMNAIPVNLNLPNPLPVSVQNAVTVASVQNPVTVQGSVSVSNTVQTLVTNTSLPVVNAPSTHLSVQFPSAQPVNVVNMPTVNFPQPIQSRVYNRLSGASPNYNELFVNVTAMPEVNLAANQTVNVAQPVKVMNADAPNQHLSVNINSPLSSGRVRVIHETTLNTLVTNTTAQPVEARIHDVNPAAQIGVKNTASNRLYTSDRVDEVNPTVAFYAYNRVLQGSSVVDPSSHSGANKKFLETRVDTAPDRPVHVQFVGDPIQVNIDDIELEADLFDYRLPVKQSGYERIHWGRHAKSTSNDVQTYSVPFVIQHSISAGSFDTNPNTRHAFRVYIDTRHSQQGGIAPETGYVQVGPNRFYAPSLHAFRRFLLVAWCAIRPAEGGSANPWNGYREFGDVLGPGNPPPVMSWGYTPFGEMGLSVMYRDHARVLQSFMRRGGERIALSAYRIDYRRPLTLTEVSQPYNWGNNAANPVEVEVDRLAQQEHEPGLEIYGKLVGRSMIGLDQLGPYQGMTTGFGSNHHVIFGRTELTFEGPSNGFVIEFDYQGFREADMLGPVMRYGSSYLGNPSRRYLNHLPIFQELVFGGVLYGIHSA